MKTLRMLSVVGAAAFLLAGAGWADTYVKSVTDTQEMQIGGQTRPASSDTMEVWMTPDRAVVMMGNAQKFIVDVKKQMLYFVRPDQKAYAEIPAGDLGKMIDSTAAAAIGDAAGGDQAAADSLRQKLGQIMGNITYKVESTDSTRKIDQWNTRKYIVTMTMGMGATVTSELWATSDVTLDWEMYRALMMRTMAFLPDADEMYAEARKIDGLAVLATVTTEMMGVKMTAVQRLLEVDENRPAPAGAYEIPEGFEKANNPFMIMGQ